MKALRSGGASVMTVEPEIPNNWSEVERWAWKRIKAGDIADFNERDRETDPRFENLDPRKADGWGESRRLRVAFLQTIVIEKPFVDAIPFKGVQIFGALIDDAPLDFAHASLKHLFWLEKSRLLVDIECRDLRADRGFSLEGSHIGRALTLSEARIDGILSLALGAHEGNVNMISAKIGGVLDMSGATFSGVNMDKLQVGESLFMRGGATFTGDVNLTSAKVGSNLETDGSTFKSGAPAQGRDLCALKQVQPGSNACSA